MYTQPAELLAHLIRFDTTNPPGNEAACIAFLADLLRGVGIEPTLLALDAARPALIARLPGMGTQPPLLLYGHVDVVTTAGQRWSRPPFAGEIVDGWVWGRGTLDMKGGVAMMVAAFMQAKVENWALPGDVILCIVPDEEVGGDYGAKFLVDQHPHLFAGVRHAIGEFGGFSLEIAGTRFYPIMIAEKQICQLRATVRGRAGHGSTPLRGEAMAQLARLLAALDSGTLPVHHTPPAQAMLEGMLAALPEAAQPIFSGLLDPAQAEQVLALLGDTGQMFAPLLHNTAVPTMLHASDKINVIPAEIIVGLDGRLLPGQTPDDLLRELRALAGDSAEFDVVQYEPGPQQADMTLFPLLADVLQSADPGCHPIPLLLAGVTDGRHFARLGIQTYGYLPMRLPADFNFAATIHAADERIPAEAVAFGARAIGEVLRRFVG